MLRKYQVFLMQTNFRVVPFGQGEIDAKSPTEAIKLLSPFKLGTVKRIKNEEVNKYRREYDIIKVVNMKGVETFYAVQKEG